MELDKFLEISHSLKVLYVEDDKEVQEQTERLFGKFFTNLDVASDGKEGLEKFVTTFNDTKSKNYDLVISDIEMPEMNGIEMLKEIIKMDDDIHTIILTAFNESEYLLDAISLNIGYYLLKPFNLKKFIKNMQDISFIVHQRLHIEQEEQKSSQYADILDKVAIVTRTDLKGVILYANEIFCDVSGYTSEELVGSTHNIVRHPDMPKTAFDNLWNTLRAGQIWRGKVKNKAKDGSAYVVNATIFPVYDELNINIIEYMAIRILITDEEEEKREFKKKVIQGIQVHKSKESEYKKDIIELEKKLKMLNNLNDINQIYDKLELEKKRADMFRNQVFHYEKDFKLEENKYNKLTEESKVRANVLTTENQQLKKNAGTLKDKIIDLNSDNSILKDEMKKQNELNANQFKRIKELDDIIEHLDEKLSKK